MEANVKEKMSQPREAAVDAVMKTLFLDKSSSTGAMPEHGKRESVIAKPRLPTFSGEPKDSSFTHWQYEVKVLLKGPYDEFTVGGAVHQSLKSPAADSMVNMGPDATIVDVLDNLKTRYGCVLPVEALTKKLYALKQKEGVTVWAFKLEEVVYQMQERGGVTHNDASDKIGLKDICIKETTFASWASMPFDELLVLCRTLEEEYGPGSTGGIASVHQQTTLESKMDQILKGFQGMDARVKTLESVILSRGETSKPNNKRHMEKRHLELDA